MIKPSLIEFSRAVQLARLIKALDRLAKSQKGTKARAKTMLMARDTAALVREAADEALKGTDEFGRTPEMIAFQADLDAGDDE